MVTCIRLKGFDKKTRKGIGTRSGICAEYKEGVVFERKGLGHT